MFSVKGSTFFWDVIGGLGALCFVLAACLGIYAASVRVPIAFVLAIYSAGAGLSLLIVFQLGRALVHIAETNTAILERLSKE